MAGPNVRSVFPMLAVQQLERSLGFYRDLLGGAVEYQFPPDEPVFVTVRLGESVIGLGQVTGQTLHGRTQVPATGHRIELCVYVDDVDATVARCREAGIEVVTDPADQPWGERVAYVADPDGNLLMLVT